MILSLSDFYQLSGRTHDDRPEIPVLTFSQSTGHYTDHKDLYICKGWSGRFEGFNNPEMQHMKELGPLPRGFYFIGKPETAVTGPYSLRLTPFPTTEMYGRDGFLIHGADKDPAHRKKESKGCPIMANPYRHLVVDRGYDVFRVVL